MERHKTVFNPTQHLKIDISNRESKLADKKIR